MQEPVECAGIVCEHLEAQSAVVAEGDRAIVVVLAGVDRAEEVDVGEALRTPGLVVVGTATQPVPAVLRT